MFTVGSGGGICRGVGVWGGDKITDFAELLLNKRNPVSFEELGQVVDRVAAVCIEAQAVGGVWDRQTS